VNKIGNFLSERSADKDADCFKGTGLNIPFLSSDKKILKCISFDDVLKFNLSYDTKRLKSTSQPTTVNSFQLTRSSNIS
jgi:hypothetical protein